MFIPPYRVIKFEQLFPSYRIIILRNFPKYRISLINVLPSIMSSLEQCPHFFPTYGHNQYIQFQNLQIVFPPKHDKILNVWPLFKEIRYMFIPPYCLVLLCDQNSFGRSKMVLVWPNWFGLMTKMKWSRPKWFFLVQIVIFYQKWITIGPDQFILVMTISFWSWPNHYGQVQINLVRPKPFWTDQNCFGHIEGQGISLFAQLHNCLLLSYFFFGFCFSTTAPPLHSENSTISTSVSKYYKCPEEALTPVMQRTIPISDIPVIKDIACFPDPTWTEVNANMHCTPSIMEQVVR